MRTLLLLIMINLFIPSPANAEDKLFLYGEYYAGMTPEELLKSGPADCDKYPDNSMICNRTGVEFAGMQWTQFFEFKNGALTCVAFGSPLSLETTMDIMNWLQNEKYAPVQASADNKSINFAPLYEKDSQEEFKQKADKFNQNLPGSDTMNAWLLKSSVIDAMKKTGKMPANAIVVRLGGSKTQGNMYLCFEPARNFKFQKF